MESFSLKATEDGSSTLYFPEYDECTHTVHGAYTEALYKHVIPSGILDKQGQDLVVLDIGFGLGYNLLALLCSIDLKKYRSLRIISFEKEKAIAPFLEQLELPEPQRVHFKLIRQAFLEGSAQSGSVSIELRFGDARKSLRNLLEQENTLKGKVSAVFHDPHSPGKNSELWTVQFFNMLHQLMEPTARLTTYSFARQVRGALVEAGFTVAPFTSDKFKKEGTIASVSSLPGELSGASLTELMALVKSTPYRDNAEMNLDREEIRLNRVAEMAQRREKKLL